MSMTTPCRRYGVDHGRARVRYQPYQVTLAPHARGPHVFQDAVVHASQLDRDEFKVCRSLVSWNSALNWGHRRSLWSRRLQQCVCNAELLHRARKLIFRCSARTHTFIDRSAWLLLVQSATFALRLDPEMHASRLRRLSFAMGRTRAAGAMHAHPIHMTHYSQWLTWQMLKEQASSSCCDRRPKACSSSRQVVHCPS